MSGYIPKPLLGSFSNLNNLPIFITHGTDDDLIPVEALHQAKDILCDAGADVEALTYEIGHGLTQDTLSDIAEWYERIFITSH